MYSSSKNNQIRGFGILLFVVGSEQKCATTAATKKKRAFEDPGRYVCGDMSPQFIGCITFCFALGGATACPGSGFACLAVINGVFMQETFKVAQQDDQIMLRTEVTWLASCLASGCMSNRTLVCARLTACVCVCVYLHRAGS
jgi:hypothetical protein